MTDTAKTTPERMLLSLSELAELLGVSDQHLYNLRDTGRFPIKPIRLGRSVRYSRKHIEQWIDSGCSVNWRAR